MEDNIQLFKHPEFGKIRVVMIDGEPWFVGKDVAKALGYKKPENAVKQHVPDKFKGVTVLGTPGGTQKVVVIHEAGMYKLVMRSQIESAEKFSDWVCGDVLISIRKTGSYSVNKNTTDPLAVEHDNSLELLAKALLENVALEREKFNVENSEETKNFKKAQLLRELASAARDFYLRDSLVNYSAKLITGKNFIEGMLNTDEDAIVLKAPHTGR